MRPWKMAAAAILAAASLGAVAPRAEAGQVLVVKRFLMGHLEANTNRFVATGGKDTTNARRDDCILFVFTAPVDLDTLDSKTVRIGIPSSTPGLLFDAKGSFSTYTVNRFDANSGQYVPKKTYRNRILFDPTRRWDLPIYQNPDGFTPYQTHTVTIPGVDMSTPRLLLSTDGTPLRRTFTTTFKTTDRKNPTW